MADIEQRALGLLNESRIAFGLAETNVFFRDQTPENEALCRALQRQEPAVTSELRPAVEVWWKADTAFGAACLGDGRGDQAAAAVIEADRKAVRAEQAAELAKWKALTETLVGYANHKPKCRFDLISGQSTRCDCGLSEALTSYKEQRDAS